MERNADGPAADEHVRYLRLALSRLSRTPPRLIVSPATQPRRAAVALIIHISPPANYVLPPIEKYDYPQTVDELFKMEWVKQSGCVAEILYIRRRAPTWNSMDHGASGSSPQYQHIAFPGGRMEANDEGEMYTAMRTTWEELGIDLAERDWIPVGQMDDREITTSLGKRLLMILSPFVFIRASPYPFHPIPPNVPLELLEPNELPALTPPTIYSVPLPSLLSSNLSWSHMTIDISSRLAPLPNSGIWSRVFSSSTHARRKARRNRAKPDAPNETNSQPSPTEGSVEEAIAITSSGTSFWIWVLRASMKFFFKTLIGDMKFSALILEGRVVPYGNELEATDGQGYKIVEGSQRTKQLQVDMTSQDTRDHDRLKVWGLTLGMTLDLLSGMQPRLYHPAQPSFKKNILDHGPRSSVSLAGLSPGAGRLDKSSDPSMASLPVKQQPNTRSRSASLSVSHSIYPNEPPAPRPFTPPISTAVPTPRSTSSGTGTFSSDGKWVPSPGPRTPRVTELVRYLEEELKDMDAIEGIKTVWTPSMTCVFPRFSIPDVNFWIWVFGKRYREVIRGWELSMRLGGSNDRRINWSGQALSAFYAAVRKALVVVIILRVLGILAALGLWSWWLWKKWT